MQNYVEPEQSKTVNNLIKKLGPLINLMGQDFCIVGSSVDRLYLEVERKSKDIDLVYFGEKDLVPLIPSFRLSPGRILGDKLRGKTGDSWVEIFLNIKYPYFLIYGLNFQTPQSRYNFITTFLNIPDKPDKRYKQWFNEKKRYFLELKLQYELYLKNRV